MWPRDSQIQASGKVFTSTEQSENSVEEKECGGETISLCVCVRLPSLLLKEKRSFILRLSFSSFMTQKFLFMKL